MIRLELNMLSAGTVKVNEDGAAGGGAGPVLVIFPGSLGDFLCFAPTLEVLRVRHAGQPLEIMGRGAATEAAQAFGLVSAVQAIDRAEMAQIFSRSGAGPEAARFFARFAAVYSWSGHGDPGFRARLAGLVDGRVETFKFLRGGGPGHASSYYLGCLGEGPHRPRRLAPVSPEPLQWVEAYWQQHDLHSAPVLVLHPGSGSVRKQWDLRGFENVSRWWRERVGGRAIVVLGPVEEEWGLRWQATSCEIVRGLCVARLGALLRRASAYVGNDSGVSHLAGAVGAAGVVVFGPTDPRTWRPLGGRLVVIRNRRLRDSAPETSGIALDEVPAEQVVRALDRLRRATSRLDKVGG